MTSLVSSLKSSTQKKLELIRSSLRRSLGLESENEDNGTQEKKSGVVTPPSEMESTARSLSEERFLNNFGDRSSSGETYPRNEFNFSSYDEERSSMKSKQKDGERSSLHSYGSFSKKNPLASPRSPFSPSSRKTQSSIQSKSLSDSFRPSEDLSQKFDEVDKSVLEISEASSFKIELNISEMSPVTKTKKNTKRQNISLNPSDLSSILSNVRNKLDNKAASNSLVDSMKDKNLKEKESKESTFDYLNSFAMNEEFSLSNPRSSECEEEKDLPEKILCLLENWRGRAAFSNYLSAQIALLTQSSSVHININSNPSTPLSSDSNEQSTSQNSSAFSVCLWQGADVALHCDLEQISEEAERVASQYKSISPFQTSISSKTVNTEKTISTCSSSLSSVSILSSLRKANENDLLRVLREVQAAQKDIIKLVIMTYLTKFIDSVEYKSYISEAVDNQSPSSQMLSSRWLGGGGDKSQTIFNSSRVGLSPLFSSGSSGSSKLRNSIGQNGVSFSPTSSYLPKETNSNSINNNSNMNSSFKNTTVVQMNGAIKSSSSGPPPAPSADVFRQSFSTSNTPSSTSSVPLRAGDGLADLTDASGCPELCVRVQTARLFESRALDLSLAGRRWLSSLSTSLDLLPVCTALCAPHNNSQNNFQRPGRLMYVNPALCKMNGCEREALAGQPFTVLLRDKGGKGEEKKIDSEIDLQIDSETARAVEAALTGGTSRVRVSLNKSEMFLASKPVTDHRGIIQCFAIFLCRIENLSDENSNNKSLYKSLYKSRFNKRNTRKSENNRNIYNTNSNNNSRYSNVDKNSRSTTNGKIDEENDEDDENKVEDVLGSCAGLVLLDQILNIFPPLLVMASPLAEIKQIHNSINMNSGFVSSVKKK